MKKILLGIFVLQTLLLSCSAKREEKPAAPATQVNDYPDLTLTLQDGSKVRAKGFKGNNIFILFQPDCRHCQVEAINIEQRLNEFKDYTLYFISSRSMEEIQAFAETLDLADRDNVRFAWTSTESVLTYYGPIQTPSIYIYKDGKLKASFNGETDVQNVIDAL